MCLQDGTARGIATTEQEALMGLFERILGFLSSLSKSATLLAFSRCSLSTSCLHVLVVSHFDIVKLGFTGV